jgi:hypothetical protein
LTRELARRPQQVLRPLPPPLTGSITGSGLGGLNEWPDAGLAVRALAAVGPSVPAIQATGYGPFCRALREVTEPLDIPGAGIRIASELGWITVELRADDSWPLCFPPPAAPPCHRALLASQAMPRRGRRTPPESAISEAHHLPQHNPDVIRTGVNPSEPSSSTPEWLIWAQYAALEPESSQAHSRQGG